MHSIVQIIILSRESRTFLIEWRKWLKINNLRLVSNSSSSFNKIKIRTIIAIELADNDVFKLLINTLFLII